MLLNMLAFASLAVCCFVLIKTLQLQCVTVASSCYNCELLERSRTQAVVDPRMLVFGTGTSSLSKSNRPMINRSISTWHLVQNSVTYVVEYSYSHQGKKCAYYVFNIFRNKYFHSWPRYTFDVLPKA